MWLPPGCFQQSTALYPSGCVQEHVTPACVQPLIRNSAFDPSQYSDCRFISKMQFIAKCIRKTVFLDHTDAGLTCSHSSEFVLVGDKRSVAQLILVPAPVFHYFRDLFLCVTFKDVHGLVLNQNCCHPTNHLQITFKDWGDKALHVQVPWLCNPLLISQGCFIHFLSLVCFDLT